MLAVMFLAGCEQPVEQRVENPWAFIPTSIACFKGLTLVSGGYTNKAVFYELDKDGKPVPCQLKDPNK